VSRQNKGYIAKRNAERTIRVSSQNYATGLTLDAVVLALGQLGMSADFLHEFMNEFNGVYHDIVQDIFKPDYLATYTNSRNDKTGEQLNFAYSKQKIDEMILQYIHEEDYLPFDYRYGLKELPK